MTLCIQISSPFFCLFLLHAQVGCCPPPLLGHYPLPAAAQPSPCSHLADALQSSVSSCITSQECQTDTLHLTPRGAGGVCLLEGHGTSFITYLFISVRQATLAGNRCSQSKANGSRNHNTRLALFISVQKNMQLGATGSVQFSPEMWKCALLLVLACYWKHSLLPRNVEIYPSSISLLPRDKAFTFSFAKNLWNSRHKSQSIKTNTSKPVLHS